MELRWLAVGMLVLAAAAALAVLAPEVLPVVTTVAAVAWLLRRMLRRAGR